MNDNQFWNIVESVEYRNKFGTEHPFVRSNGKDYYTESNLRTQLTYAQADLNRATDSKNVHILTNRVNLYNSWLVQARWIRDNQQLFAGW